MKYTWLIFLIVVNGYSSIIIEPKSVEEIKQQEIKVNIEGQIKKGNTDSNSVSLSGMTNFGDGKSYKNLFIGSYEYGESNMKRDTNKGMFHYRFTHNIIKNYDYELFIQDEYNEFQNQKYRFLLGSNVRKRLLKYNRVFIGIGGMYSKVAPKSNSKLDVIKTKIKMNMYLLMSDNLTKNTKINVMMFFQPTLYNITEKSKFDITDFRLFSKFNIENKITDKLSFLTTLNYDYHSRPYTNVECEDVSLKIGIQYKIK